MNETATFLVCILLVINIIELYFKIKTKTPVKKMEGNIIIIVVVLIGLIIRLT